MGLTQVNTDGVKDDAVTAGKIPANAVRSSEIADDAVGLAQMAAGTDGQVITYDASGNPVAVGPGTDGQVLTSTGAGSPPAFETLPASNNYTHPNHSGEVTSTGDGATVIASNVVDEDNLKVSNSPTNGYFLSAQSGNTGGLTWAEAGGGKLLQMVGNSSNNNTVISSTSFVTTNMSQTITPSKTGSKMLFMCAGHYSQNPNGGSWGPQVQVGIYKQIGSGTDTLYHQVTYDYCPVITVYDSHHFAATIFDPTATLNTTDDIKYTIYAKLLYASHQMRFNPSGYTSLVIQEYDA